MARPKKDGLLYFSFDVDFFSDKKIKSLRARYGNDGIVFYIYLLTEIYRNSFYIRWDEDYEDNAIVDLNLTEGFIKQVMTFLVNRSLLTSITVDTDTILTSPGIQKRYQEAAKALRRDVVVNGEYWLLKEEDTNTCIKFTQNESKYSKNSNKSCKNESKYSKNSTKESKVKESKVNIIVSKDTIRQTDVQRCVEAWNSLSDCGIKSISKMTSSSKRYQSLVARIKEYSVDDVLTAIDKIRHSKFLQGRSGSKRVWVVTFDWFVLPNNFPKVLEGNYDDKNDRTETAQVEIGGWQ